MFHKRPGSEKIPGPLPPGMLSTSLSLWDDLLHFLPQPPKRKIPSVYLSSSLSLRSPFFLLSSTQNRSVLWFLEEESRSELSQPWREALARFLPCCLGDIRSWRTTSLSHRLGKCHVTPPCLVGHHGL